MNKQIKLLKNNDNRDWTDVDWLKEFYEFLTGTPPDSIIVSKRSQPVLSKEKAHAIIWYLQEHLPVFPDQIEGCDVCGEIYDSYAQGHYSELTGKSYCCESCEPRGLYEREQRAEKKQQKLSKTQQP